jgi:predicted DNA-binding transcriptional regulator AlpA
MKQKSENRQEDRVVNEEGEEEAVGMVVPMLLTIPDAARVLAIGRTTLYELIAEGALEVVRSDAAPAFPSPASRSSLTNSGQADERIPSRCATRASSHRDPILCRFEEG